MNNPTENTWSDASRRAAAQARRNKAQVGSRVRTPHGKGHILSYHAGFKKRSPITMSVVMDSLKQRDYHLTPSDFKTYIDVIKTDGGKKWKKKLKKIA